MSFAKLVLDSWSIIDCSNIYAKLGPEFQILKEILIKIIGNKIFSIMVEESVYLKKFLITPEFNKFASKKCYY